MKQNKIFFENLDSIRFIAAIMVYLGHGLSPSYQYLPINSYLEQFLNTISDGGTGVSIFFVLSGFLITYLLISEYELNSKINLSNFYIRRILRIWPLYFLVVGFSFLLYPFLKSLLGMNSPLGSNILYHLTFLSNFDVIHIEHFCRGNDAMSQNITWSVSIEEQFYLFWPALFVFLPKKVWIVSISAVIGLSLFFRILHHNDNTILYFHTFSVLLDLGIGGLFAYLIKETYLVQYFFEKSSTRTHLFLFILSFCLLFWKTSIFSFAYGNAVGRIFISISFALIISAQAMTKSESILNLKKLVFANKWGKYTYGIYLLHPIALTLIDVLVRVVHINKNTFFTSFLMGIIGLVFTLFLSKVSYKYYESRFLILKDKFTSIQTHK